jgi:hypothetical protein
LFILIPNVIGSTDGEDDADEWFADIVRWADQSKISGDNYATLRKLMQSRGLQYTSGAVMA